MLPSWYSEPPILIACVMVIVGFYMLMKGADVLVDGAVGIAQKFKLAPAVIGATVVAFGTSMPELVVSISANFKALQNNMMGADGPAAIAIGNVVGSNIFNVGAILGISALLKPVIIPATTAKFEYPVMLFSLILLVIFSYIGSGEYAITRIEGMILTSLLLAFTWGSIKFGKIPDEDIDEIAHHEQSSMAISSVKIVIGALFLMAGGDVCLNGALTISKEIGLSERVIGLTVMAIGTSLPELVTSVQAVRKNHVDVATGNVIGSNLFNVFCVIGISSIVLPLPVSKASLTFDYWWMLGFSFFLVPFILLKKPLNRLIGVFLVFSLTVYVGILLGVS